MSTREHGSTLLARHLAGPPRRSQTAIAERCKVTQQTVSRWARREDEPLDFETQLLLEEATAGAVPVESWLSDEAAAVFADRLMRARRARRSAPSPAAA